MSHTAQDISPVCGMSRWGKRKLAHHTLYFTQEDKYRRDLGTIRAFLVLVPCLGSATENMSKCPKVLLPGPPNSSYSHPT